MSFSSLLNSICEILRLQGLSTYDFTSSDEGEVIEVWSTIDAAAKCRLDRASTPSSRRQDGYVETGTKVLFVEVATDIRDGDRVRHLGKLYQVNDSTQADGMIDPHHKEVIISLIDWEYS